MFLRWVLMLLAVAGLAACSADRAPDAADAAVADPASAAAQADAAREPDEYEDDDVLLSQHPVPHVVVKEAFITAAASAATSSTAGPVRCWTAPTTCA